MSEVEDEITEVVSYVDCVRLYGRKAEKYFRVQNFKT